MPLIRTKRTPCSCSTVSSRSGSKSPVAIARRSQLLAPAQDEAGDPRGVGESLRRRPAERALEHGVPRDIGRASVRPVIVLVGRSRVVGHGSIEKERLVEAAGIEPVSESQKS